MKVIIFFPTYPLSPIQLLGSRVGYGYRRLCHELNRKDMVDDELVRKLMHELDLTLMQVKRRRKSLTVPNKHAGELPDLLGRDFTAETPGAKMVGDITKIDTGEGALFLDTVIDCYPKSVIDWKTPAESLNDHLRSIQQSSVATTP